MPFRAFDDSDLELHDTQADVYESRVLMPFRAFDDSDTQKGAEMEYTDQISLNALPGIR